MPTKTGHNDYADRLVFESTGRFVFNDPDQMADIIPGGQYGLLPLTKRSFEGQLRATFFGNGVALRSAKFEDGINARIFHEKSDTVNFFLPNIIGNQTILNGKIISPEKIHISPGGAFFHFINEGPNKSAKVSVNREIMYELIDINFKTMPDFLRFDTYASINPRHVQKINDLHISSSKVFELMGQGEISNPLTWEITRATFRDFLLAEVIDMISSGNLRREHQSSRYQTISMLRIEKYIDDNIMRPFGMIDICLGTELPLRTIERIIRNRTGFTALNYLKMRRLAFARKLLLHPTDSTTITNTALSVGLPHFGRFSNEYKIRYGELPSETLKKSRA